MANMLKHYGFEFSSASAASPELSAAQNCFKMTLVVANIVFLIFGSVLCAVGAYAMQSKAGSLAGETLPQGIIAVGVFVILLSVLGCVAAFRESRVFLGIYCAFLTLFVIILMAVGIGVYAKKDSAWSYMAEGWCEAPPSVQADIQNHFTCCGLYIFNDSKGSPAVVNSTSDAVPPACPNNVPSDPYAAYPDHGVTKENGQACLNVLVSAFNSSYQIAGGCAIAFAVLMGIGMAIVCVLMSGIKEKKHLEEIRKLHRKLREAKEDPNAAAAAAGRDIGAALAQRDADSGYGYGEQVDMSSIDVGELDQHVDLGSSGGHEVAAPVQHQRAPVDEYDEEEGAAAAAAAAEEEHHYVVGGGGQSSARSGGGGGSSSARNQSARGKQQQQQQSRRAAAPPPVDDEYEDEEEASTSRGAQQPGYARRDDEYDEEDN